MVPKPLLVLAIGYCGEVRQTHLSGEFSFTPIASLTSEPSIVLVRNCFVPPSGVSTWSTPSNGVEFVVLVVAKDSHCALLKERWCRMLDLNQLSLAYKASASPVLLIRLYIYISICPIRFSSTKISKGFCLTMTVRT